MGVGIDRSVYLLCEVVGLQYGGLAVTDTIVYDAGHEGHPLGGAEGPARCIAHAPQEPWSGPCLVLDNVHHSVVRFLKWLGP